MDGLPLVAGRVRALLGIAVLIAAAGYFLLRSDIVLGDPDLWWHIQAGRDMLASHSFPTTDSYSYTFAGQPWIAKEWLSQVIFAFVHQHFGWNGVTFVTVLAAALAIALAYREVSRWLAPPLAAIAVLLIAVVLTQVVIARPHVFTLPLAVLFTARLFRAADDHAAPPFWLLGLVTLWANLHGSFTLAFVVAALAFIHLLIETRLSQPGVLARWVVFGLLCPVAALINPYGWTPFQINLDMMAGNESMPLITEWLPFNAGREVIVEFGLMAALAVLIGLRPKLGWGKVIFVLFALHMFFTHIRFVYVFFLLVPVVIAPALAAAYRNASALQWGEKPSDGLEVFIGHRFALLSGVLVVGALVVYGTLAHFAPPPRRSIDTAMAFIHEKNLTAGPVFNGYNLGGVLIFNGIKTYIDGRAEQLFRGPFIKDVIASSDVGGETVLAKMLAESKATWTIMPALDIRNSFMTALPGWTQSYSDDYVTIFTRSAPQ